MAKERVKRKLSAILCADVVGYSQLMGEDESATLQTLEYCISEIIEPIVKEHDGRIFKQMGDGFFVEFSSAVDGVECALDWQKKIQDKEQPLQFRIGINLGDVIAKDDDMYGDGVNIAARIEKLADPGGICISQSIYEQVKRKINLGYEYLGEQEVKNISEPIKVYKLLTNPEDAGKVIHDKKTSIIKRRWLAVGGVAVFVLVVAAITGVWKFLGESSSIEPASVEKMAFPLPQKPSIAVMPFENFSDDPGMDKFVDGFTGNIITLLSSVPQLFVISSTSSFAYKGKPIKVQQVAEELGVQYVLEGSIQKSEDLMRITVQFIDALEGHHLWAERYDKELEDMFDIQDQIALNVCSNLRVLLSEGEQDRLVRGMTRSFEAWDLYLQAESQRMLFTKEGETKARELLQQSLAIDPDYVDAWIMLASTHTIDARFGYSESREDSLQAAEEALNRALALDDNNSSALGQFGTLHLMRGEHDKAITARKRALAINPNNSNNIRMLAWAMFASGEPEEALVLIQQAMRLNPSYPSSWLMILQESYRLSGRYDEAIETIHEELRRHDHFFTRTRLALYYAQTGRDQEAREEITKVLQLKPNMNLQIWKKAQFFKNKDWLERDLADLKRVGLPEKAAQTTMTDKDN